MKNLFSLFFVFCFTANSLAMDIDGSQSSTNCHCFKERTFDQQKKFAADPYLLTTSFNSFISANFNISKRQIVMMLMQGGVQPEDLLIGLYVARAGEGDLRSMVITIKNGGTWKEILSAENIQPSADTGKVFDSIAAAGDDKTEAVEAVTGDLLKEFFGISDTDIAGLRKEGATGREMTLVYILEKYGKPKKKAVDILRMKKRQEMSWGEIANSFGLTPKETGKLLAQGK